MTVRAVLANEFDTQLRELWRRIGGQNRLRSEQRNQEVKGSLHGRSLGSEVSGRVRIMTRFKSTGNTSTGNTSTGNTSTKRKRVSQLAFQEEVGLALPDTLPRDRNCQAEPDLHELTS